ncbi:MAG: hypothetical protein KAT05_15255 [Spirochaetes bacterium]|nr:hypothetical protein [Spirochaetota bacterium]
MKCKLLILLFFFLIPTIFINANEKGLAASDSFISFNFNQKTPIATRFSDTTNIDYKAKSLKMRRIGFAGIPLIVIGITFEIAGLVLFTIGYSEYLTSIVFNRILPIQYLIFYYGGIAAAMVFNIMFLGGLVMTIVGFAVSKYYEKKARNVSFNTFTDADKDIMRCGFVIRM